MAEVEPQREASSAAGVFNMQRGPLDELLQRNVMPKRAPRQKIFFVPFTEEIHDKADSEKTEDVQEDLGELDSDAATEILSLDVSGESSEGDEEGTVGDAEDSDEDSDMAPHVTARQLDIGSEEVVTESMQVRYSPGTVPGRMLPVVVARKALARRNSVAW